MKFRVMIVAASVLVLAGCSSGGGDNAASTSTTMALTNSAVPPTSPVQEVETTSPVNVPKLPDAFVAEAIMQGDFGEPVDLGNGVIIAVSNPTVAHDREHPWLEVDVRTQNGDVQATTVPGVQLVCSGLSKGGGNLPTDSYPEGQALAAGAEVAGTAQLVIPGDEGFGDPQPCLFPAYVRVDASAGDGSVVQRRYDLDEKVVSELNELVAQRQCVISPMGCESAPSSTGDPGGA